MDWYVVYKKYVNYLQGFDSKVGYAEYENRIKLFLGVLIELSDFSYYVPISSRKNKHLTMRNSLDFHKIQDSERFYAVLNLNNMIPIIPACVFQLKYDQIENYRPFKNELEKVNYIRLLQKEKAVIDAIEKILIDKAEKLRKKCAENPNSILASRCCNFKLLEEKALLYDTVV